ncbi:four helix bundle protein [Rubrivirga sp.]|uniref:four helix bundle protein n=1 Tax=Rubrivirga sp. TaxID=1885344 RepID=UPI003B528460
MPTFRTFEEIVAWQKARALTAEVYALSRSGAFRRDFGLRDQICRAAVSVMSNVAEGFERGSRPEFARFLRIARGSAGEVRSQLYVALDADYIDQQTFDRLAEATREITHMLNRLIRHLETT